MVDLGMVDLVVVDLVMVGSRRSTAQPFPVGSEGIQQQLSC